MGLTNFRDLGEVADAGLGDGINGGVGGALERLPKDSLFWIKGQNPTAMVPYAEWDSSRRIVRIDLRDDVQLSGGQPAIGIRLPKEARLVEQGEYTGRSTIFDYKGTRYEVFHNTVAFSEEYVHT